MGARPFRGDRGTPVSSTVTADTVDSPRRAHVCSDEPERLRALHAYSVLDTPIEAAFDDITLIASHVCGTPIAIINLIDGARQWFKSERGFGVRETPLENSICAHAILESSYLEIPDTLADQRFVNNPLMTGDRGLRFYAGALLKTPDGHAIGTVCVLDYEPRRLDDSQRDVLFALARQTMAQLELRRAVVDAERAQQTHRRVLSAAGDNFSAPLSVIEVALFHVSDAVKHDVELTAQVQAARESSRQLMATVRRLSEALRLENDGPTAEAFDLREFTASVADRWLPVADRAGRPFLTEVVDGTLTSDPKRLRTILDNLIGNAFKYAVSGPILLRAWQESSGTIFEVQDSGKGIPADQQARIFHAFHQVHATRDGLGIGLSIVQRNAELIGANVSVESESGKGARFRVLVPLEG